MHVDFLIIGQGISGTFLSLALKKAGYSFLLIDEPRADTASKVAAGIINPVTGRRIVKTWLIDEVMPFAVNAYGDFIEQKDIVDFFPTPQMKLAFAKRFEHDTEYLAQADDENKWRPYFNYDFGYGMITPCYLVDLPGFLSAHRQNVLEEYFDINELIVDDEVRYKDVTARAVIFCDGVASFTNPYFNKLPFAPNKGEVLLIEAKDMPADYIFKKGINWVPYAKDVYWVGSSYEWQFDDVNPTEAFREKTMALLQHWIKAPVKLLEHKASVRPATLERRPFIGFHPVYPVVGIFNGMGTKGCSLAPYFANQFVQHLKTGQPIQPEADVKRFQRILSK